MSALEFRALEVWGLGLLRVEGFREAFRDYA